MNHSLYTFAMGYGATNMTLTDKYEYYCTAVHLFLLFF
jgi:hypothetical protein